MVGPCYSQLRAGLSASTASWQSGAQSYGIAIDSMRNCWFSRHSKYCNLQSHMNYWADGKDYFIDLICRTWFATVTGSRWKSSSSSRVGFRTWTLFIFIWRHFGWEPHRFWFQLMWQMRKEQRVCKVCEYLSCTTTNHLNALVIIPDRLQPSLLRILLWSFVQGCWLGCEGSHF